MAKPLNIFDLDFKGHHLIEAGAGTGKTYSITSLYVRALVERWVMPRELLVLTFTNDATAELKQRIRDRIRDVIEAAEGATSEDKFVEEFVKKLNPKQVEHLKKAYLAFDEAAISTIHGFCQRILAEYHIEFKVPANFGLVPSEFELILDAIHQFWVDFFFSNASNDDYERWLSEYLNIEFQSPDYLLKKVHPLIKNSDIILEPNIIDFKWFRGVYTTCNEIHQKIKDQFGIDKQALLEILHSEGLSKTYYKNPGQKFEAFQNWAEQNVDCPKPIENLKHYGRFIIEKGTKKNEFTPELDIFQLVDAYLTQFQKFEALKPQVLAFSVYEVRKRLAEIKARKGGLGYDDLLVKVRDGLNESEILASKLAARYPIMLIDEFQDTDHKQYAIFDTIASKSASNCLIMIGDPKQAIYKFRGADLNTYLQAKRDVPEENKYTLLFNYRSSKELIKAINVFFEGDNAFQINGLNYENAEFPEGRSNNPIKKDGKKVSPLKTIDVEFGTKSIGAVRSLIAQSVAAEIIELLNENYTIGEKSIQHGDIAVLVDSHKNAELMQSTLWKNRIRSVINSKSSVFSSKESDELFRILSAISHPGNIGYLKSALATNLLGVDKKELIEIDSLENQLLTYQSQFSHLHEVWQSEGLLQVFRNIESIFNLFISASKKDNIERVITNYKHLKELLIRAETDGLTSTFGLLRFFRSKREQDFNQTQDDEVIRLESDDDLIQIVTHHASKGLEYKVVFCPFLWKSTIDRPKIPILSNGAKQTAYLDASSSFFEQAISDHLTEERAEKIRVTYVALTRAKSRCYVYDAHYKTKSSEFNALESLRSNSKSLSKLLDERAEILKILDVQDNSSSSNTFHKEVIVPSFKKMSRSDYSNFKRTVSFSSLAISGSTKADEDAKAAFDEWNLDLIESETDEKNEFTLPKGKDTGNLLHHIFEHIDFTTNSEIDEIIDQSFDQFNFDKQWIPTVRKMVLDTISQSLAEGVSLNRISNDQRLVEIEFMFPLKNADTTRIFSLIGHSESKLQPSIDGFMKGFIDLTFWYNGRYYILDYKSNYLGSSKENYSIESLNEEMKHSMYNLQYHIYTIALVRYLTLKNPGFNYKTDFGGVFYVFLRGLQKGSKSGIYFDKPKQTIIEQLNEAMG